MGVQTNMARSTKSYVELQRDHITAELRLRESVARDAAVAAWQTAYEDLVTDPSLAKAEIAKR